MDSNSPKKSDLKLKLRDLIREKSYREGDFVLSSGKRSTYYIDLKATTLHPNGAAWIGALAVEAVLKTGITIEGVGGLTLGADPIATAVSLAGLNSDLFWPAYIVRKEPKAHGTSRYLEGAENLKKGAALLVVEDVVTTGASSLKAVDRLIDAGFNPRAVLTVVDREEGGAQQFTERGLRFIKLFSIKELSS